MWMACKMKMRASRNISVFLAIVFLVAIFWVMTIPAGAVNDGNNNEIWLSNVGIGTTTPQARLVVMGGNTGIGTIAPTSFFQVAGTVAATAFSGDGSSLTNLSASSAGGFNDDGAVVRLTASSDNVGIGTTSASNGKLLVYGGNVGIGTIAQSPTATLEISTNAAQDLFKVLDAGSGDVSAFTIRSDGNVGIGSIVPRGALEINNTVVFSTQYDNGNSGAAKTIDWNNGNNQKVTMTNACTFTFTAPGSVSRLLLQMTQDGTGSRTAAWPATVKWPSGSAPTLTTTATTGVDIVSCFFDGTNYYCTDALDFR